MLFSGSNLQRHANCIPRLFLANLSNYCKKSLSLFAENTLILIVDNDTDNLLLTKQVVKLFGYSVITAKNGKSALEMIEQHQPALVLSEVMLPEIDGINVTKCLRDNHNPIPVIILTSLPSYLYLEEALIAGCNGYIEKPFQIEDLETAIKQVVFLSSYGFNY